MGITNSRQKMEQRAGFLDERISISRKTPSDDGMGGETDSWAELMSVWANAMPLSGRERDMANQTESPRNYRFTLRASTLARSIKADDRLIWREKIMNIRFIGDDGPKSLYMTIDVEDGVAA